MKPLSFLLYFTGIIMLALVLLTFVSTQPVNIHTNIFMLPGNVPLEMLWIPPGSFMMGSPEDEQGRMDNESPQHEVTISEGFWMGKYPITQAQWEAVMGNNPSDFIGDNRPVERVSWNDIRGANGFLEQLNTIIPRQNFRLPSEAVWEYTYRAGSTTRFYWGDDPDYTEINDYAWYMDTSGGETQDVGLKLPNAWGLLDMAGNVLEWCEDDWHDIYIGAPTDGSTWVDNPQGNYRVLRGVSWGGRADGCRAAYRAGADPDSRNDYSGFRVVFALD